MVNAVCRPSLCQRMALQCWRSTESDATSRSDRVKIVGVQKFNEQIICNKGLYTFGRDLQRYCVSMASSWYLESFAAALHIAHCAGSDIIVKDQSKVLVAALQLTNRLFVSTLYHLVEENCCTSPFAFPLSSPESHETTCLLAM